jgi:hypothetical protein
MSGYADFAVVLDEIANDANQKGETCNTASGLYDRMCKLETGFFACFWHAILDRLNSTSKKLQDDQLDLNTAVNLLKSLETFVKSLPDRFEELIGLWAWPGLIGVAWYHQTDMHGMTMERSASGRTGAMTVVS